MQVFGRPSESVDLSGMDRRYEIALEPAAGQGARPFFVTARLRWRWRSLHAARTSTTEEDMLTELFGREPVTDLETEAPWMRVDVVLRAFLPWGKPISMPPQAERARWIRDITRRLERLQPVEAMSWTGSPRFASSWTTGGELAIHGATLEAWRGIELPRCWDDPEKTDPHPGAQLAELFAYADTALAEWAACICRLV
jgi:hypothetical protein